MRRPRKCKIYTLDGEVPAMAHAPKLDRWNRDVSIVRSDDGKTVIHVPAGTYERKFWNEEVPTFYDC